MNNKNCRQGTNMMKNINRFNYPKGRRGGAGEPGFPAMENRVIIIGAGIAGLYTAYKIRKLDSSKSITILEANPKASIGGRMGTLHFQGTEVVTGAGVGRKKKDDLLIQLLHELKVPYDEFLSEHYYSDVLHNKCNVKQTFMYLKKEYEKQKPAKTTFKDFAVKVLGQERYKIFITCAGYTDYENEDVEDTLYHYGFDDNYESWTGLSIPWMKLIVALIRKIGMDNIHVNTRVERIEEGNHFYVHTSKKLYTCNQVIIATTIDSVRKLLPGEPIYREIKGQPFLRVYAKFSAASLRVIEDYVKGYTIVPGPLQKIIPMDQEKGVYMIAYSDNIHARKLRPYLENTLDNRAKFCEFIKKALVIPKDIEIHISSIVDVYWEIGTHYYEPLDPAKHKTRKEFIEKAQHPRHGILVVGEAVSMHQGWVEGALESVEKIM